MKERIYVAAVDRTIRDQIEIEIRVVGEVSTQDIERKVEEMAAKLNQFDPTTLATSVKTSMKFLDLIDETETLIKHD